MKKVVLAAIAGFAVAFVAGMVSAPEAQAQTYQPCRSNRDCTQWSATYCGGDPGFCYNMWGEVFQCICP